MIKIDLNDYKGFVIREKDQFKLICDNHRTPNKTINPVLSTDIDLVRIYSTQEEAQKHLPMAGFKEELEVIKYELFIVEVLAWNDAFKQSKFQIQ